MTLEELFVGGVAVLLGLVGLAVAAGNWERFFQPAKIRWIERLGGRRLARLAYATGGLLLIALGLAIALGRP